MLETLIAVAISVIIGMLLLQAASSFLHWSALAAQRNTENASLGELADRWEADEDSAWAIFTPPGDVLGASNADGHEVDFFTRDGHGRAYFWAYTFDAQAHTITRYLYDAPGSAPAKDTVYAGITKFATRTYPLTALQDASTPVYSPLYASATLQSGTVLFYPAMPWIAGGNNITWLRVETAANVREMQLATQTAPTGFTIVLSYTPSPAPSPTPAAVLSVWPAAVRYAVSGTNVADAGAPRVTVAALLNGLLGGGIANAASTCPAQAFPSASAMANNQPYSQGTRDPFGAGITLGQNGCYGGQIVLNEPGYAGAFLDKQLSTDACTNTQIYVGGWVPTTYGPTAYQSFSGGNQTANTCTIGFTDSASQAHIAQTTAEIYDCGPAVNQPDFTSQQDCLWYGAEYSGGPGIGIVGEAEVWYYAPPTSSGPVLDCSDPSVGCTWSSNGGVAYCAQPIDPSTGAATGPSINEVNPAGFNCSAIYTATPPAHKWTTIPCSGTRTQCINEPGSVIKLP